MGARLDEGLQRIVRGHRRTVFGLFVELALFLLVRRSNGQCQSQVGDRQRRHGWLATAFGSPCPQQESPQSSGSERVSVGLFSGF